MTIDLAQLPNDSVVFLAGIVLSSVLLPLLLPLYKRLGLIDRPNARSSHSRAIPRGVGLVVVLVFWAVVTGHDLIQGTALFESSWGLSAFAAATLLLVGIGFADDARGIPTMVKLVIQILTVGILIAAGFVIPLPEIFGEYQLWVEGGLTFVWILTVINAVNFSDGSDGLCTSLSLICMLVFVALSALAFLEDADRTVGLTRSIRVLGLSAAGSALPFLLYNLAPAKCFLGDAGSMFFGLVLALLGILLAQYGRPVAEVAGETSLSSYRFAIVPWFVLIVPVGDSVRVAVWRLLRKRSPFRPDNTHLHHLLHRAGLSPNQMVFSVCLLCFISGLLSAFMIQSNPSSFIWMGIGLLLVLGQLWFLKTSYRVRKFVTTVMHRRLLLGKEVPQGYENALAFKERVEQELARAKRRSRTLSLALVSVSGPELGTPGASPLENPKFLEDLLHDLRREDVKARFTPDRIAFLLVETDKTVAVEVAKRIENRFVAIQCGESKNLQFGIGLSSYPDDGATSRDLFNAADAAAAEYLATRMSASADDGEASRPLHKHSTE